MAGNKKNVMLKFQFICGANDISSYIILQYYIVLVRLAG